MPKPGRNRPPLFRPIALFGLLLLPWVAAAEFPHVQFLLRNGDRLTGLVVSETTNRVTLTNAFLGEFSVPKEEIVRRDLVPRPLANVSPAASPSVNLEKQLQELQASYLADQISGPLGMAQVSGDLAKQTAASSTNAASLAVNGLLTALSLVANISVGIGFLNLLPIPVLDGGHLLFYAYEAVARRPLAAKVQAVGYRVGLALVLGLMLFATVNDLQRLRVFNFIGGLFS